jgi:hypothetical protein
MKALRMRRKLSHAGLMGKLDCSVGLGSSLWQQWRVKEEFTGKKSLKIIRFPVGKNRVGRLGERSMWRD